MNDEKLVSIIIPVFNREEYIYDCVKSALNQTYKNVEIVVVDNNSTDNTWKILNEISNKYEKVKLFKNDTNIGPVKNWERGINEATGYYCKILWSDDLIHPEFIEKSLELFSNHVGFVITKTRIFDGDISNGNNVYILNDTGYYKSSLYIDMIMHNADMPYSPGCALFRLNDLRSSLKISIPNTVNVDTSMNGIGSDLLIFLLIAKKYKYFGYLNNVYSYFRFHQKSISVSSNDGKLQSFYMSAKIYFANKYMPKYEAILYIYSYMLIILFPKIRQYGFKNSKDFFVEMPDLSFRKISAALLKVCLKSHNKILRKLKIIKGL